MGAVTEQLHPFTADSDAILAKDNRNCNNKLNLIKGKWCEAHSAGINTHFCVIRGSFAILQASPLQRSVGNCCLGVFWKLVQAGRKWDKTAEKQNVPLRGEVHELRGELVGRKLGRRFFHHLLQLLEGCPPGVIWEAQNGELNLRREIITKKRDFGHRSAVFMGFLTQIPLRSWYYLTSEHTTRLL